MLGPFTTTSRLTPIHQVSLAVLSHAACASMSTTTTMRDRGQLWPHGMGPINKHLRTRLCKIAHTQWRRCDIFDTTPACTACCEMCSPLISSTASLGYLFLTSSLTVSKHWLHLMAISRCTRICLSPLWFLPYFTNGDSGPDLLWTSAVAVAASVLATGRRIAVPMCHWKRCITGGHVEDRVWKVHSVKMHLFVHVLPTAFITSLI